MLNDKMCMGIIKDELMCRIDPERHEMEVQRTGCRTMDFTKRPIKGYVLVDETGMRTREDFEHWVNLSLEFNSKAKASKKKKGKKIGTRIERPPASSALYGRAGIQRMKTD